MIERNSLKECLLKIWNLGLSLSSSLKLTQLNNNFISNSVFCILNYNLEKNVGEIVSHKGYLIPFLTITSSSPKWKNSNEGDIKWTVS